MLSVRPTYSAGFARNKAQSAFPGLWDGLVGLWSPSLGPTGLTLRDWSGNQNHGALTNMDAATDWVVGERGYVLDYDGSNDFVDIGDTSIVDFGGSDFSIGAWISVRDLGGGRQQIVSKDQIGRRQFIFDFDSANDGNNRIGIIYFKDIGGNATLRSDPHPITDNDWHYVVAQRVGNSFEMFLDGGLIKNGTGLGSHGTMAATTAKLQIGEREFTTARDFFNGQIGDVSIYKRALTQQEISAMFAGASPLVLRQPANVAVPNVLKNLAIYGMGDKYTFTALPDRYELTAMGDKYKFKTEQVA